MRISDFINYLSFGKTKYTEEEYLLLYESYCDLKEKYNIERDLNNSLKILLTIAISLDLLLILFFS